MGYDLHGLWDADVTALGSIIDPQPGIRGIDVIQLPLWHDTLGLCEATFGLAFYGQDYQHGDQSCGLYKSGRDEYLGYRNCFRVWK